MLHPATHPFTFLFSSTSSHLVLFYSSRLVLRLTLVQWLAILDALRRRRRRDTYREIEFNLEMNIESNEQRADSSELRPSLSTFLFVGLTNRLRFYTLAISMSIVTLTPRRTSSLDFVESCRGTFEKFVPRRKKRRSSATFRYVDRETVGHNYFREKLLIQLLLDVTVGR